MVHYNAEAESLSQKRALATVISKTTRLPREEVLYRKKGTSGAGKRVSRKPEQKRLSCIEDHGPILSRSGDVGVNFCPNTDSTANARLLLDQRRKTVRCDLHSEMLPDAETDNALRSVSRMLISRSNIFSSKRAKWAARVFKDDRTEFFGGKKPIVSDARADLDTTNVLQGRILQHF